MTGFLRVLVGGCRARACTTASVSILVKGKVKLSHKENEVGVRVSRLPLMTGFKVDAVVSDEVSTSGNGSALARLAS